MKKNGKIVLTFVCVLALLFAFAACSGPSVTGIEITAQPTKTAYTEGETFDPAGMVVSKLLDNSTKEEVKDYTIDKTGALTPQDTKITVTWGEFQATVTITVTAKEVVATGIEIATPPTKTTYLVGERFDAKGMTVNKVMSDDTKIAVTDFTVNKTEPLSTADTSVTVTWQTFTATQNITVREPQVTEIQIVKKPNKTVYAPGETFDPTGMEVRKLFENGKTEPLTDFTIENGTLQKGDVVVTVCWNKLKVNVAVTVAEAKPVRSVTDVEIYSGADLFYTRTMDVSSVVRYKAVYSDGTKDAEWTNALAEDLDSYEINGSDLVVNVTLFAKNKEFKKTVRVPIQSDSIGISELLKKDADGQTTYQLEGIVAAVASTMMRVEYILYEPSTNLFLGVSGIVCEGSLPKETYQPAYAIGDKVVLPVTLVKTAEIEKNSDSKKVYAKFVGGSILDTAVVEKNVAFTVDKSGATEISDQAGLQEFLGAAKRSENFYKTVKLNGPISLIQYGTSPMHYRFFFGTMTFANSKVDGVSAVFMNSNQRYITGNTVGELLNGDKNWKPVDWSNPGQAYKDVYALFIGGNNFYHEFIILSKDDVSTMPKTVESVTLTAPSKYYYAKGETLDLTGGKLQVTYNYGDPAEIDLTTAHLTASTIPDFATAGEFDISGTLEGKGFAFSIVVKEEAAQSIALKGALPTTTFSFGDGFEKVVSELTKMKLTVTYPTQAAEEIAIQAGMIQLDGEWTEGEHTVTIRCLGQTTTVQITVESTSVTVSEIKQKAASDTIYELHGVVVSSAFISGTQEKPANGEILLKDKNSNDVIGLKGLNISYGNPLAGLNAGDEILVQVTIGVTTTEANFSECGKLAATIVSGTTPVVVSSGNNTSVAFDSAVVVDSQDALVAFLQSAEVRKNNAYKLVKLRGAKFMGNNGNLYITFTGTALSSIEVDGRRPYLHVMNESMTLGNKTYADVLIAEGATLPNGIANPFTVDGDVYVMYVGGQGKYYHQFVLLGANYVVRPSAG